MQLDGSPHDWLEGRGPRLTALGMQDDASGKILAAQFFPAETAQGYFRLLQSLLHRFGVPTAFYGDHSGIFVRNDDHCTVQEVTPCPAPTHPVPPCPGSTAVHDVEISLLISIALVILVVFAFLRNVRATFIPSIVVPVSLIGTFGVMYLAGYSLDNLSLMALTISTGFVVDDAIVVIENVTRYLERGVAPMQAALEGAQEIGFTVVSISISLTAVFIPILLMGGVVGRLFREFSVTLSVAILVSLAISLTATPMMCSRLLKPHSVETQGRLYRASEKVFSGMLSGYEHSLRWVLRHSAFILGTLLFTIALNLYLLKIVPKGFFPQEDTGRINGGIQGEQDTSFQAMRSRLDRFVKIINSDPGVQNIMAFTGAGTGNTTNTGFVFGSLKPLNQRDANADEIVNRLRPKLAEVPGATLYLQASQDLTVGGRRTNAQFQYTIQSDNLGDLTQWGPILLQEMRKLPGLTDVNTDQQNSGLEASLVYDRETASRLGISPQLLDNTLYDAFGQRQVSTMYTQLNQYHVVMEVAPQYLQSPAGLADIYVHPKTGGEVPLSCADALRSLHGSIGRKSPGTVPLGDAVVQFGARRGAERRRPVGGEHGGKVGDAHQHPGQLHGNLTGLPILAGQRTDADSSGFGGRLYRARNFV